VPTQPPVPAAAPLIPLSPEARAAYQSLYDTYEQAIEATTDPGLLATLEASQTDVDNILTKDNMYRLHADSTLFAALTTQIKGTSTDLQKIKAQVAAVASHIALAGNIIAAIDKVISIVPGV
jgi:hypothetical protein